MNMSSKLRRQNRIKEILNKHFISNLDDLIKILSVEDINVTQATLSRDFASMGVIRAFNEFGTRYIFNADESGKQIAKLIGFEILSVTGNESLVVIRTLAGRAQGVAHYIDRLNHEEVLGTIAGDDTVLVIPDSQKNVNTVIGLVKQMMSEPGRTKS
jgi:transcriptional regulator of arginine metabolism